ncbi:MAG: hypothetical protein RL215_2991, partial [Planctomycetota bacterium]
MKPKTAQGAKPRSLLSAAALSTALHAALAGLAVLLLRGCSLGNPGLTGGEKFRDVGLFVVDGSDSGLADNGTNPGEGSDQISRPRQSQNLENTQNPDSNQQQPGLSDSPRQIPNLDGLLNTPSQNDGSSDQESKLPDLIGPGNLRNSQSGGSAGNSGSPIQPSTAGGTRKSGGFGGQGETTFMNIVGVGRSFVYVIDTSSSMDGPRLRQAKSQLKASLRLLQPNQQFAVIFYNEITRKLRLR